MNEERYKFLMNNEEQKLSKEEIKEGWHFCWEWDGLLVGPNMGELEFCHCHPRSHKVYLTIPEEAKGPIEL